MSGTGQCPGVFSFAHGDAIPDSYLVGSAALFHGSFALHGLCCPLRRRYYDPIRQSRMLLTFSHCGYTPSTYASETFPTFTAAPHVRAIPDTPSVHRFIPISIIAMVPGFHQFTRCRHRNPLPLPAIIGRPRISTLLWVHVLRPEHSSRTPDWLRPIAGPSGLLCHPAFDRHGRP